MLQGIAFYLLAAVATVSGLLVVTARNPVHSVLWLILAFFSSAGLFVLLGAEFLAMLLVVVYVGAVAVLFLFVVMMLDVDFLKLREGYARYLPLGAIIAAVLLVEMIIVSVAVVQGGAAAGLPAPGAPVMPSRTALPVAGSSSCTRRCACARWSARLLSTKVIARANVARSPARMPDANADTLWAGFGSRGADIRHQVLVSEPGGPDRAIILSIADSNGARSFS